jgi:cytosine/uracil/thiamine/allantoin permease
MLVHNLISVWKKWLIFVAFVAMMWTAILTVQAGAFLQRMIEAVWPSFINFPNHLPDSAGITSAGLLSFFLYWFLQSALSLMPISKLRILFWVKGVIVPPTFLALFLWAVIVTHGVRSYIDYPLTNANCLLGWSSCHWKDETHFNLHEHSI